MFKMRTKIQLGPNMKSALRMELLCDKAMGYPLSSFQKYFTSVLSHSTVYYCNNDSGFCVSSRPYRQQNINLLFSYMLQSVATQSSLFKVTK